MELSSLSYVLVGMMIPNLPEQALASSIYTIRGQRVMLDRALAALYCVPAGALNRAVKRNLDRFPADFMFQITQSEWDDLKCQIGISSWGGDRRGLPFAFTEQGVAMLSSVLRSKRAIKVNIAIMRAFVKIREMTAAHRELAQKCEELEGKIQTHDQQIQGLFAAVQQWMDEKSAPGKKIGFKPPNGD